MVIAGLDLSINGSAVSFSDGKFYYQTTTKKRLFSNEHFSSRLVESFGGKLDSVKYYLNAVDLVKTVVESGAEEAAIENYAFGKKEDVGYVFSIAEAAGMVKFGLMQNGIKVFVYSPTEVKKFATESGSATKVKMVEAHFKAEPDSYIKDLLKKIGEEERYGSPVNDLCDAYWLMKIHQSYSY